MKKFIFLFAAVSAITLFSFTDTTDFEGKIVYAVDIVGTNLSPEAKSMMAGSKSVIYIKGTKSRMEMDMIMQKTISIYDYKTDTSITLIEVMGNKYKLKMDDKKSDKKAEKTPEIKVNVTSETKVIAGYTCKKAEVTVKDEKGNSVTNNIWFTEAISNYMNSSSKNGYHFKGIKGMPLEYEMKAQNGMVMRMTATSVIKEPVSDSKFEVPADYKEITVEEMQKEMIEKMSQH
jgi:GLPGLI family protein